MSCLDIFNSNFSETPLSFFGKPSLINCCSARPKTLRLLRAEHSLDFSSWFPRVHRSSLRVLCGSGAGFWVFSLGILHGMRLIVKGDFLTNISHILLKPPGLVRNQMTAWALRFWKEERGQSQAAVHVPAAVHCFVVSVIGAKRSRCTMKHCLHVSDSRWSRTGGNYFTQAPQWCSADGHAANSVFAPLMNKKHKKGSGAIQHFPCCLWSTVLCGQCWWHVSIWTQLLFDPLPLFLCWEKKKKKDGVRFTPRRPGVQIEPQIGARNPTAIGAHLFWFSFFCIISAYWYMVQECGHAVWSQGGRWCQGH